jgi:hypothetical protein
MLMLSPSPGRAQTPEDYIVSQFDDGTLQGWAGNYGNAPYVFEFDPNEDRGPGASPGAMKVTIDFNLCADPVQNQRDWEKALGEVLDLTRYTALHFSVKVDPSSSRLSDWGAGALGGLRPHIRLSDWGGDSNLGSNPDNVWVGSDAYGNWVDYTYPIDQTLNNQATRQAMGVWGFDMWSGWGSCAAPIGHTNTVIFWMDNIWFELNTNTAPPPPPTMALEKAGPPGVQITMDNIGDQWQRDAIVTPSGTGPYHWTAQGTYPVSYSMTIADFPSPASHPGFEAHMYLINQDTSNGNETYGGADWNVPDIFILRIENGANDVSATIQWKTNLPNANPPAGALNNPAVAITPSAVGTWTVTFNDPTNGVLTGPGSTATNFTLPEEAVINNFSPSTSFIQFGIFKNDGPNDGHNNDIHGTYSRVMFDGQLSPFDDSFNGSTLTDLYAWRTTSASAVQHIPAGIAWLATWTVPAQGFTLEGAGSITGPWTTVALTKSYQSGGKVHGLVSQSALPAGSSAFFRTVRRPFTKLQVLMPGETAAPNTPTGKTGTPTEQFALVPFNVIVNAVDEFWNIVPSTDTINITSSDAFATLPADGPLSSGSRTFSVTINTAGAFTVTATDVTDGTKTPNTGSPVTVQ